MVHGKQIGAAAFLQLGGTQGAAETNRQSLEEQSSSSTQTFPAVGFSSTAAQLSGPLTLLLPNVLMWFRGCRTPQGS